MVKVETKEKLAKLLAMEDIDIQHKQVKTAMFDVKNRMLILPTWKDMPNHLYDLLVGHEVGHALYTPNDEKKIKSLIKKSSKHCMNVVEDARIESLMKKRYPGLVKSFYNGYQHLIKQDFFGLSKMDFENINLLDKLNLHFKVPSAIEGVVEFNEEEQSFVDRIEKIKRFDELEKVCVDICEYIKENRTEEEQEDANFFDAESEDFSDFDESDEYEMDENNSGEGDESDEDEEKNSDETGENESKEESQEEGEDAESSDSEQGEGEVETVLGNSDPDYMEADDTPDDLRAKSIENFEEALNKLNDDKTVNEYLTLPKNLLDTNINNYKDVWKNFRGFYDLSEYMNHYEQGQAACRERYSWGFNTPTEFTQQTKAMFELAKNTLDSIKKDCSKNVSHMAMEFERKKSADIYKRTSFSKTGVLDTNKMFSAKYNEDIFKKNMRIADGKNHGLCMFIDWSGSMSMNMAGCVKQLIELMLFCKKVNIPFEVYSFTDVSGSSYNTKKQNSFKYQFGDLVVDKQVTLNNYFSSRMTTKEFNEALIGITVISNSFRGGYQQYPVPPEDQLGYTPLNGAIILSEKIIREFRTKNNIHKVHSIWITDGEGNNSYEKFSINEKTGLPSFEHVSHYAKKVIIQDDIMKKHYPVTGRYLTPHIFNIVKDRLGCNVVGFFLDSNFGYKNSLMKHWYSMDYDKKTKTYKNGNPNEFMQKAKKDGFIVRESEGYDEYYVISNKPAVIKTTEIEEKMTARRMATIFSNQATKFKKSRVILSRFIDLIAV